MNRYCSQANQDEFVYNLLDKKNDGFFVDFGASYPIYWNNTYFLENQGWNGISFEKNSYDYSNRKSKFFNFNLFEIDLDKFFIQNDIPKVIDYLSIDIDDDSTKILYSIPFTKYKFKIITIEHDSYRLGHKNAEEQRHILNNHGFYLICKNVTAFPLNYDQYYEDWWIQKSFFNENLINKIQSSENHSWDIIDKFYK